MDSTENSVAAETRPVTEERAPEAETEAASEARRTVDDGEVGLESSGAAEMDAPASAETAASLSEEREAIDCAALARDVLDQILQGMAVPATVEGERQPDGSVRLLVEGPEMGVVIGKHGTTINALQYLVGLIVQKRTGERVRLVIDAEGYRSRREQALKDMALSYAQRVKETGQEAVLDALQSYERRIIHNSLVNDADVFTYSEGEEPDRRVVISPREPEAGSVE